ncbi:MULTISPECIES: helix-turn-helix domain-containing protein [Bacteroides]|uniref:helix-turn-helix domain-containing protein n=1 Tax=Bacteroides TaxID=816 RepID=UPI0004B22147|nr:helix-turn-helix transcriptional regulator [Bacteroides neonati]
MGKNIKYVRLRPDFSSEQIAEGAGVSPNTLIKIEKGDEGIAVGYYSHVLAVLGLDKYLILIKKG